MFFFRGRNLYVQAAALLALTSYASADEFNCRFQYNGLEYDLTGLAGEHQIMRERRSPPTTMVDKVKFDLCADLEREGSIDERDQVRTIPVTCAILGGPGSWYYAWCLTISVHQGRAHV